jgi:superfamily II DNA or RNA helicase
MPRRVAVLGSVHRNPIFGYGQLAQKIRVAVNPFATRGVNGFAAHGQHHRIFVAPRMTRAIVDADATLLIENVESADDVLDASHQARARWIGPTVINPAREEIAQAELRCNEIVDSWAGVFNFREENREAGLAGLRRPQVGALYAALAHWTTSDAPATIVMPTGTGKTETMLALLVKAQIRRLLVVVPNSALRDQIAEKFSTLGALPAGECVPAHIRPPIVATLRHRPRSVEEVDAIFRRANVIVAGMSVAGQCLPEVQDRMAELCSHLFIDEAHHIAARTWTDLRRRFEGKRPILQFTATPFRTDTKRVDGRFIYSYPLSRAQAEGYFRAVSLLPVEEYDPDHADVAIAERAVAQLDADLAQGLDHLLMARCDDVRRAEQITAYYAQRYPEHAPVVIHSRLKPNEQRERLARLGDRSSRILVCVDMFGEGFDLPQLKIAALHDRHKSLAITLQFVGRFTRDYPTNIGDAHVVANVADDSTAGALRNLYAEDADWNFLLRMLSEGATSRSQKRNELLEGFTASLDDVPLQVLFPRMSAVVYRTNCEQWSPMAVLDAVKPTRLHTGPVVNPTANIAIFITRDEEPIRWGEVRQIQNVEWNLHVLHWNEELELLFINSSSKDFHESVAEAVGGTRDRIMGRTIFRALGDINRLILTNLGVSHALGRNIRYTMFMGPDIAEGLSMAALTNRKMSNVFGLGYENEDRVTVGGSHKGRLWSHRIAWDLSEWVDWCAHIGAKLLDENIAIDTIFDRMIKPRAITERPRDVPVMIAWPEDFDAQPEDRVEVQVGNAIAPLFESELSLTNLREDGPLSFAVMVGEEQTAFVLTIREDSASYDQIDGPEAYAVVRGRRRPLHEWFNESPPIFYFASGNFLVFNELFELPSGAERASFDPSRIDGWDWQGVDLTVESQGPEKRPSIQRHVIETLLATDDFEIVFDGDGKGEVADIIAIHQEADTVTVRLFHCKYSGRPEPGARIDDFYEVCGQAQKSVHWRENPRRMLRHLLLQEQRRDQVGRASRFEKGDLADLKALINRARYLAFRYEVVIVQPGIRHAKLAPQFLDVLGATELFLKETFAIPLDVIVHS